MKSKEELNELKKEVEAVNEKLQELTEEELAQVSGGGVRSDLLTMLMFGPIAHESDAPGRIIGREGRN